MSTATRTDAPTQAAADSHDLIRVHGARENNLVLERLHTRHPGVELPPRRPALGQVTISWA